MGPVSSLAPTPLPTPFSPWVSQCWQCHPSFLLTADRKFISWVLGVVLGRPTVQTRFHGLHRVVAGVLYLRGVIKVCSTPQLAADPNQAVEQLDGWVIVRPAEEQDCKPGSSRGKPLYVVEYPQFLTATLKPMQVGCDL